MLRPKLPAPVVYTPTPAAPVVHVPAAAPACSCQHHTPAPGPAGSRVAGRDAQTRR